MLGLLTPPSPSQSEAAPRYADVAVPRRVHRTFTYLVPRHLADRVQVGTLVRIPFGSSTVTGLVVALSQAPPLLRAGPDAAARVCREILSLGEQENRSEDDGELVALARWLSDTYLAPLGQCLRLLLPPVGAPPPAARYRLTERGRLVLDGRGGRSTIGRAIGEFLRERPAGASLSTLQRAVKGPVTATLRAMAAKGWLQEDQVLPAVRARRPDARSPTDRAAPPPVGPSDGAHGWSDALAQALSTPRFVPVLLRAPTEVRLPLLVQAAEITLGQGRAVLAVTGEVGPAVALAARFRARWGERVQLLHGRLSARARAEVWSRIRQGRADLVVGTRSAVFAPLRRLGLLIVDAEDEPSLKEEQAPRYHAREVAWQRARRQDARLVLGAAQPSLETLAALRDQGLTLAPSAGPDDRPAIDVVDLRRLPFGTILSARMLDGVRHAMEQGTGVVLYHNRKGFSPVLSCRDCGAAPRCTRCSVSLALYRRTGELRCHVCGGCTIVPDRCPACLGPRLDPFGTGTEALEDELRRHFPAARIARLDRAALRGSRSLGELRARILAGGLDIVIGTQLVFQAAPLPRVGFVGVPCAELGLHRPDFRAGERTYRSLADAVGLARGRREGGRVVLQTRLPRHPILTAIASGDPGPFYDEELSARQALDYPPFATLVSLRVSGPDRVEVEAAAGAWAAVLEAVLRASEQRGSARKEGVEAGQPAPAVCGPIRGPLHQARGQYRLQLVVRGRDGDRVRSVVRASLAELEARRRAFGRVKIDVDVDPLEL